MNLTNAKCVALVSADAPIVKVENGEPWWLDPDDGWWRLMFTTKLGNYGPLRDSLRAALERYQRDQHEGFCADYANDPSVDPPKVPIVPDGILAAVERECETCKGRGGGKYLTDASGIWDHCPDCDNGTTLELVACGCMRFFKEITEKSLQEIMNEGLLMTDGSVRPIPALLFYTDTEAKVVRRC